MLAATPATARCAGSRQSATRKARTVAAPAAPILPGRGGPFVVSGSVVSGRLGRIACQLSLRDAGNGDRLVARCFAVFRAPVR